jgi:hypothetical protein
MPSTLERADAGGDEDGLGDEAGAGRGFDIEPAVFTALHGGHFLAQVEGRGERLDLLEQVVGQFLAGAHRHRRDVVDRLVRIQLHALAADGRQRIDHVGLDFQQAQLEHLEQANRARTDNHCVGVDGAGKGTVGSDAARFVGGTDCHALTSC